MKGLIKTSCLKIYLFSSIFHQKRANNRPGPFSLSFRYYLPYPYDHGILKVVNGGAIAALQEKRPSRSILDTRHDLARENYLGKVGEIVQCPPVSRHTLGSFLLLLVLLIDILLSVTHNMSFLSLLLFSPSGILYLQHHYHRDQVRFVL